MFRKITFTAIAAAAVIGASMIAPTSASAFGGSHAKGVSHVKGVSHTSGVKHVNAVSHLGRGIRPGHGCHNGAKWNCWHPNHNWHVHYRLPRLYGVAPVAYVATQTVAAPCTCLTKEYTPEGAVLFKDRCTNEAAMNPPVLAPQQTGMIQPQQ